MPSILFNIVPVLIMITIFCIVIQKQHLLMTLLAMEGMILMLTLSLMISMSPTWSPLILIMLTFGACEASLGLACMVIMARSYGNDHLHSLMINKC